MKFRVFLIVLAGCLILSACGVVETTPETGSAATETDTEAPETAASDEATVMTDAPYTEESTAESTAAQENRYAGWDYYNDYVYMLDGQPKYWIEFDGEFYLHCMFRSDSSESYEVVYTLYPDWDAPTAQELTIRTVLDAAGNDISYQFERLTFAFSSEDLVLMQVKRDESTLAGGEGDNIMTGDYVLLPRS